MSWFNKTPKLNPQLDECHKKLFYDLESIQQKLDITQAQVDTAWRKRKKDQPVYLCHARDKNFFISNYTE